MVAPLQAELERLFTLGGLQEYKAGIPTPELIEVTAQAFESGAIVAPPETEAIFVSREPGPIAEVLARDITPPEMIFTPISPEAPFVHEPPPPPKWIPGLLTPLFVEPMKALVPVMMATQGVLDAPKKIVEGISGIPGAIAGGFGDIGGGIVDVLKSKWIIYGGLALAGIYIAGKLLGARQTTYTHRR